MTDLTTETFTYTTGSCHLCGQPKSPENPLFHDGRSFIVCHDALACMRRVERMERAEYEAVRSMARSLRERLRVVLKRQGELETSLGLYDKACGKHRAELERIEEETI